MRKKLSILAACLGLLNLGVLLLPASPAVAQPLCPGSGPCVCASDHTCRQWVGNDELCDGQFIPCP